MTKPAVVDLDTIVVQTENLLTSELDGETVLMSLARPSYYGLDSTGQRIWELVAQPRRVAQVCSQLIEEYDVERSACEQQVRAFLGELHKEGLIRIVAQADL
jgi:hypothetical protein